MLLAACLTLAASVIALAFVTRQVAIPLIIAIAIVSGAARSVGGTSYNTLSFCDVPEAQMPHANALSATVQQLGAGLGVAAATVALRLGGPAAWALGAGTLQSRYTVAFLLVALFPLAAIPGISRMHRNAGSAARTPRIPG